MNFNDDLCEKQKKIEELEGRLKLIRGLVDTQAENSELWVIHFNNGGFVDTAARKELRKLHALIEDLTIGSVEDEK